LQETLNWGVYPGLLEVGDSVIQGYLKEEEVAEGVAFA
jgi:hypothetical protein